jgi:NAD(P)H dehydrogenase (quinone)
MATKILIVYYSAYGHIHQMAQAVEAGAKSVADTEIRLRRVAELQELKPDNDYYRTAQEQQKDVPVVTHDDLRWADGIAWGTPTRYGNMTAQMKAFIDSTASLWLKGELEDKPAGVFTSTATIHGGQETTIFTTWAPLVHLGMILIGSPYGQNQHILTTDGIGGSPYGPSTLAGPKNDREPIELELLTARNLGTRLAKVSGLLKPLRAK